MTGRDVRRGRSRGLSPGAGLFVFVAMFPRVAGAEESPPELTPYRVEISIGLAEGAEFTPAFRERLRRDVGRLVTRSVGERWSLTVRDDEGRDPAAPLTPASVPVERREAVPGSTLGLPAEAGPDKYFVVSVASAGPEYRVSAREWDRLADSVGPARTETAATRDEIPRAATAALLAAFRPVATIESADGGTATLAVRAGAIPSLDRSATAVKPGTLFVVQLRKRDRDGLVTEVRPVPFTYLEVSKAGKGKAIAAVRSALRRPLSGRRGSVEAWAVAAPASEAATRLVVTRREDGVPLPGRVVELRPSPAKPGGEEPPAESTSLTDRSGAVSVAADPNRPLVWLTVRSGDATLMRLPLAPGVEREVTLPLGDDARRLDAESRISIVTGELIETVAKRATLLAKARTAARAGRYEEADAALAGADVLPDAAAFRRRIAAVETPAAKAADEARDRLAAARIRALGRKAAGLADRYLNAEALRMTREEVEELKRTDPDRVPPRSG